MDDEPLASSIISVWLYIPLVDPNISANNKFVSGTRIRILKLNISRIIWTIGKKHRV